MFYTLVLQLYLNNGKKKREDDTFLRKKKTEEKQSIATIMISVDGKGTIFPVKLKLQEEIAKWSWNYNHLNKDTEKGYFKKDPINLIEPNHQINLTSDHSVSSNDLFKSHLYATSFNMFLTLQQLCEVRWFCVSVCCKDDVNV